MSLDPNIITRSTAPRVVDLSDWRRRYTDEMLVHRVATTVGLLPVREAA